MERGAEERVKKYLKDEDYPVKVIIYSMERGVIWGSGSWYGSRNPRFLTREVKDAIENFEKVVAFGRVSIL